MLLVENLVSHASYAWDNKELEVFEIKFIWFEWIDFKCVMLEYFNWVKLVQVVIFWKKYFMLDIVN